MSTLNHRVLFTPALITLAILAGCDSKSKNEQGRNDFPTDNPVLEQPDLTSEKPDDASHDTDDGLPSEDESELTGEDGAELRLEGFALDILETPGVWRVFREIDSSVTPAEVEARGGNTLADLQEMDSAAMRWQAHSTGFFSVATTTSGYQVTQCFGDKKVDMLDNSDPDINDTLFDLLNPAGVELCSDRRSTIRKHSDSSYTLEQHCDDPESPDSVILTLERLSDSSTLENSTFSFTSDVLPDIDLWEGICGKVYADISVEGEAWNKNSDVYFKYYLEPHSSVSWSTPYDEGELQVTFSFMTTLSEGDYLVNNSASGSNRRAHAVISYRSLDGDQQGTGNPSVNDSDRSFNADSGVISILQYDDDKVLLEFSLEDTLGGVVEGRGSISLTN